MSTPAGSSSSSSSLPPNIALAQGLTKMLQEVNATFSKESSYSGRKYIIINKSPDGRPQEIGITTDLNKASSIPDITGIFRNVLNKLPEDSSKDNFHKEVMNYRENIIEAKASQLAQKLT